MERKTGLRHLATLQETRHGSWMYAEQPGSDSPLDKMFHFVECEQLAEEGVFETEF
jgi:hypothetical protein